jgi:hypothetical protein
MKEAYVLWEGAMPLLQIDGEVIATISDDLATRLRSGAKISMGRETKDVQPQSALTPGSFQTKIVTDDPAATETVKLSLTFVKDR